MRRTPVHRELGAALLSLVLPVALAAGHLPLPADSPVAVSVTASGDDIAAGDVVDYTVKVRNAGPALSARVVLEPPEFVDLTAADDAGAEGDPVTWATVVAGDATSTFRAQGSVDDLPVNVVRATAVVSVYLEGSTTPLVRNAVASHVDGVVEPTVLAPPEDRPAEDRRVVGLAFAGAMAMLAAAGVGAVIRSRNRQFDA
jgi:hypothetical protein